MSSAPLPATELPPGAPLEQKKRGCCSVQLCRQLTMAGIVDCPLPLPLSAPGPYMNREGYVRTPVLAISPEGALPSEVLCVLTLAPLPGDEPRDQCRRLRRSPDVRRLWQMQGRERTERGREEGKGEERGGREEEGNPALAPRGARIT